jgi:Ricin-type beta-trefoil lectin domain
MMRIRRLVAYAAAAGLLTAGAVGVSVEVAHANFANLCSGGPGTTPSCTLTATITSPSAITVTVTATTNELATVKWTVSCTDNNGSAQTTAALSSMTPITDADLTPLPSTADGQCSVTADVSLAASTTSNSVNAELDFTPAASPTATTTATPTPTSTSTASGPPVHPIKGFDGKCVSDKGNSSANRTKIIIWNCSGTDQAENWKFSNNEFVHNGKCLNDQGNGGNRSKVILYTCNGASNEKWLQLANGELELRSHGGNLCLDDPRSSTTNGTQLIVYNCNDNANQKWSLP